MHIHRRLSAGPMPHLIASFVGWFVVVVLIALDAGMCAGWWERWTSWLTVGMWVALLLEIVVLTGSACLVCVGLSWLSRGVRGGRSVGLVAAFAVGAAAWLIPAAVITEAASEFSAGECWRGFSGAILIYIFGAVCVGVLSLPTLLVMAIASAWRRSRTRPSA